jgi:hypothetical protein
MSSTCLAALKAKLQCLRVLKIDSILNLLFKSTRKIYEIEILIFYNILSNEFGPSFFKFSNVLCNSTSLNYFMKFNKKI